jgi:Xaa-Pro aminopeptidase
MDYAGRQQTLERQLRERRLDAMLITHPPNLRYLCGFTGSSGALLVFGAGKPAPVFFTDGRYRTQAHMEVERARVVLGNGAAWLEAANWMSHGRWRTLALEADWTSLSTAAKLQRVLGKSVRLRQTQKLVEQNRMVKEESELKLVRSAVELGTKLLDVALEAIRPGVREREVAAELEYAARRAGASGMAFDTIVASGRRSALPHGQASDARLPAKGFIVLDFGVILAGYCSDMTRTVHLGPCPASRRRIYEAVRQAQEAAIESVREGVPAGQVDAAARAVLRRSRLARYFPHSTGHGVGLEVHEPPRLGRGQAERLRAGMVVTIEPGVYIPRLGGVRIEDMVVVTESGCRVLTSAPKDLIEL